MQLVDEENIEIVDDIGDVQLVDDAVYSQISLVSSVAHLSPNHPTVSPSTSHQQTVTTTTSHQQSITSTLASFSSNLSSAPQKSVRQPFTTPFRRQTISQQPSCQPVVTPTKPKSKKKIIESNSSMVVDEALKTLRNLDNKEPPDSFSIAGINISNSLRNMTEDQFIEAERLIGQIIYRGKKQLLSSETSLIG